MEASEIYIFLAIDAEVRWGCEILYRG